jgi:hypothetical protein
MAININALTTGVGGLETTADASGSFSFQSDGSTVISVTSSGVAITGALSQNGGAYSTQPTFRNRIINGDMRIDQRNAGASVTQSTSVAYTVDRWSCYGSVASKFTVQQQTSVVPTGYTYAIKATSSSAYTVGASEFFFIQQVIEGYNIADLAFGTANAKTVTLSFQVYSSLTGTFGGTLSNDATNRVYPFTYSIPTANTWTTISVTVAGDTSGTWQATTSGGLVVNFNMGAGATVSGTASAWSGSTLRAPTGATSVVGTSGATFYITGVQLEVGTEATPFEHRPYDMELARCQRYYQVIEAGVNAYSSTGITGFPFTTSMRTAPTMTFSYAGTANRVYRIDTGGTSDLTVASTVFSTNSFISLFATSPGGWASAAGVGFRSTFVFSSEL